MERGALRPAGAHTRVINAMDQGTSSESRSGPTRADSGSSALRPHGRYNTRTHATLVAADLLSRIDMHDSAMQFPVRGTQGVLDLHYHQRIMMTSSISLMELLQREFLHLHSRQMPDLYKVITRTYARGIQMPLEQVLTTLNTMVMTDRSASKEWLVAPNDSQVRLAPIIIVIDVLERMLCDTYALCAYAHERATEGRVRRACVEWLGEIARQQLATLQYCHALGIPRRLYHDECEAWRLTASQWYGMAARDTPDDGRWYAALAELAERDAVWSLYYYCKSLLVVHPCLETRENMMEYVSLKVHRARICSDASGQDLFVYLLGLLLTRVDLDSFELILKRLAVKLTQEPCSLLETEWGMMALCIAAAILEFGRTDAWIDVCQLAAFHLPSNTRPLSEASAPMLEQMPQSMKSVMQSFEQQPADMASVQASCEAFDMPMPLSCAVSLMVTLMEVAVQHLEQSLRDPAAHLNAPDMFLNVMLSFVYVLMLRVDEPRIHAMCHILCAHLPWKQLAAYVCGDVFGSRQCDVHTALVRAHTQLPEDWCLQGILWNVCSPKISSSVSSSQGLKPFEFSSESNMLADVDAISRFFATLTSNARRAAYVQDSELRRLLQARHTRASLLMVRIYDQALQYHSGNSLST